MNYIWVGKTDPKSHQQRPCCSSSNRPALSSQFCTGWPFSSDSDTSFLIHWFYGNGCSIPRKPLYPVENFPEVPCLFRFLGWTLLANRSQELPVAPGTTEVLGRYLWTESHSSPSEHLYAKEVWEEGRKLCTQASEVGWILDFSMHALSQCLLQDHCDSCFTDGRSRGSGGKAAWQRQVPNAGSVVLCLILSFCDFRVSPNLLSVTLCFKTALEKEWTYWDLKEYYLRYLEIYTLLAW